MDINRIMSKRVLRGFRWVLQAEKYQVKMAYDIPTMIDAVSNNEPPCAVISFCTAFEDGEVVRLALDQWKDTERIPLITLSPLSGDAISDKATMACCLSTLADLRKVLKLAQDCML